MRRHALALSIIVLLSLGMMYPLPLHLADTVAHDPGDPLLNVWVLAWGWNHLGDLLDGYFQANIFYPHRNTLAYSEHLFASVLLGWPIYALTNSALTSYNVLCLASFGLSGFGMYLLVLHLTGYWGAGLIAGILFAFAPFRFGHLEHFQLLTAQWIPFTFLFLHKFFSRPSLRHMLLCSVFSVLQMLSCGYYAVYLTFFMGIFVLHALLSGRNYAWRALLPRLVLMAGIVVSCVLPFYLPYIELKQDMGFERPIEELHLYSANLLGYLSVPPFNKLWGPLLRPFWRAEGALFPGLVAISLFAYWLFSSAQQAHPKKNEERSSVLRGAVVCLLRALTLVGLAMVVLVWVSGGPTFYVGPLKVDAHRLSNPATIALVLTFLLVLVDRPLRGLISSTPRALRAVVSSGGFYLLVLVLAFILSMGPSISVGEKSILYGPYKLLYHFVPGFDMLRAPARIYIFFLLGLGCLAGRGVAQLLGHRRGLGRQALGVAALSAALIAEFASVPIPLARIPVGSTVPLMHRLLAEEKEQYPIIELPMGLWEDYRYIYFSTYHWKRLVNGASGYAPPAYPLIQEAMKSFPSHQSVAVLAVLKPRYVLLHRKSFSEERWGWIQQQLPLYHDVLMAGGAMGHVYRYRFIPREAAGADEPELSGELRLLPRGKWRAWASAAPEDAALAFDGDVRTCWTTARPQELGEYFMLDFGEVLAVRGIAISYGKYIRHYPRGYSLWGSEDGKSWKELRSEAMSVPPVRAAIEQPLNPRDVIPFETTPIRYLRITLTSSDPSLGWAIPEIDAITAHDS